MALIETPINLLVVEDNPLDVRAITRAASKLSPAPTLSLAADGGEALDHLQGDAPTDLVMLDLNLPVFSGHEVLESMRSNDALRTTPVIVVTTSDDETDVQRAYDLGANAFVNKPVGLDGWSDVMQRIEGFWMSLVRLPTR